MELWEYWKIIRKRLLLIVVLGLIAAGCAAYLGVQSPWQYRTTTTLFLNPAAASALLPFQTTKTVQSVANTYIEFMRTRSFAGLVAQQSGIEIAPEQVLAALATQYVPDTQFFRITAIDTDPQRAQIIANTAAQVLIAENSAPTAKPTVIQAHWLRSTPVWLQATRAKPITISTATKAMVRY